MIEVQNISKQYYNVRALNQVSLSIPTGEIVGVLGPNGAGKSTLFKIIAGLLQADSGAIKPTKSLWPLTSYKPDRLQMPGQLSARSYLNLFGKLANLPKHNLSRVTQQALSRVNLSAAADKKIGELSKGMRQRLALAQALIGNPSLILLDEPSNGLDPAGQIELIELVQQLKSEGKTILYSSHQLNEVTQVCDRIVIISKGEIAFENSLAEALAIRQQVVIRTDQDVAPIAPYLIKIDPSIELDGKRIILGETATTHRRQVLTLLLGAGYDVINMEHHRTTLSEIYKEALT